jgi:glutaredoxin-related protein
MPPDPSTFPVVDMKERVKLFMRKICAECGGSIEDLRCVACGYDLIAISRHTINPAS